MAGATCGNVECSMRQCDHTRSQLHALHLASCIQSAATIASPPVPALPSKRCMADAGAAACAPPACRSICAYASSVAYGKLVSGCRYLAGRPAASVLRIVSNQTDATSRHTAASPGPAVGVDMQGLSLRDACMTECHSLGRQVAHVPDTLQTGCAGCGGARCGCR
jgi:hypothetical protein